MIHNHWLSIAHNDSQPLAQDNSMIHNVLLCASKCDSWWVMLSQWLWITVCYSQPLVVNHWVILSQWLWIIVSYAESVVVNHGVFCWASGCEVLWAMLSSVCMNHGVNAVPVDMNHGEVCWTSVIHNHWLSITHHESHLLAHNSTPWFTTTGIA
jgi:hypothetical protein